MALSFAFQTNSRVELKLLRLFDMSYLLLFHSYWFVQRQLAFALFCVLTLVLKITAPEYMNFVKNSRRLPVNIYHHLLGLL